MTGYKVITEALRAEAPKWDDFAEVVAPIRDSVHDAFLGVPAFFCGDPVTLGMLDLNAALHQNAYEDYRVFMAGLLEGALEEFAQMADALVKVAEKYEAAEKIIELDVDKVWDAKKW